MRSYFSAHWDKVKKEPQNALIALIHFFFNTVGLPAPLTFTNILALFQVKTILQRRHLRYFLAFTLFSFVFGLVHFTNGVDTLEYLKTLFFFYLMLFTTIVVFKYVRNNKQNLPQLFTTASQFGLILFILSLIGMIVPIKNPMWIIHDFSMQAEIYRYRGLSYEPSFYALCLSPVFLYFLLRTIYINWFKNIGFAAITLVPLLATLSFGFFAIIAFSILVLVFFVLFYSKTIHRFFFIMGLSFLVLVVALLNFDNPVSNRFDRLLAGEDSSVKGRLTESYYLADQMLVDKSKWFGIGLGQIEIVGEKHIRGYYGYSKEEWPRMALPNASAETLATYGYLGLLLRLGVQFWLFFRFRVYRNYFSFSLFVFVFSYQLMGSFITSTVELTLWVLAVSPIFKEFDIKRSSKFKIL